MKKTRGPKLSKRAQAALERSDASSNSPATVDELLEQGSIDEESGDRWLGGDLAKALRFYQLAFKSYTESMRLPGDINLDSYYNSSRLLFHVYNQYFKSEGVDIRELTNIGEVLTNDESSVVQSLFNVKRAHEVAIQVAEGQSQDVPLDLIYNTALVYTEYLEEEQDLPFSEILEAAGRAAQLFIRLLEIQTIEFEKFYRDLLTIELGDDTVEHSEASSSKPQNEYNDTDELTSETVVQPTDIFESILASYKLAQALFENVTVTSELTAAKEAVTPLLLKCDAIAKDLIDKFSDESTDKNEMVANIAVDQINDLKVSKAYLQGLTSEDFNEIIEIWKNEQLPNTGERFMAAAENLQSFLSWKEISLDKVSQSGQEDKDTYWKILSTMNNHLKSAQTIFQATLQSKKASHDQLGVGTLISQVSGILVARADIDVQRCQIKGYEQAEKNHLVLLNNSKTLLKNAMTIANTNGGLRERMSEKLQREKKKVDAVIRMCLLESKTSITELDTILGRKRWSVELPAIRELGYYTAFGVDNIEIPYQ